MQNHAAAERVHKIVAELDLIVILPVFAHGLRRYSKERQLI